VVSAAEIGGVISMALKLILYNYSEIMADVRGSVEKLAMSIDSILKSSEDVSQRLANTELSMAGAHDDTTSSIPLVHGITDNSSEITIKPSADSYDQSITPSVEDSEVNLDPRLQSEIHASRVYRRTWNEHSNSFISSSSQFGTSWSVLSGLSLSQISTIAVIQLPISSEELWNSQHYFGSASVVKQTSDEPLRREGFGPKPQKKSEWSLRDDLFNLRIRFPLQSSTSKIPLNKQSPGLQDEEKLQAKILLLGKCVTLLNRSIIHKTVVNELGLGAGEGGKTTLLNQMRLIHDYPFSLDEREETRKLIFSNVLVAFAIIFEEMPRLGLKYQNVKSEVSLLETKNPGLSDISEVV